MEVTEILYSLINEHMERSSPRTVIAKREKQMKRTILEVIAEGRRDWTGREVAERNREIQRRTEKGKRKRKELVRNKREQKEQTEKRKKEREEQAERQKREKEEQIREERERQKREYEDNECYGRIA